MKSLIFLFLLLSLFPEDKISKECQFNGHTLFGKVRVVEFGEDIKVRVVTFSQDIKVRIRQHFASDCGQWVYVDFGEDFKIRYVDFAEDIKIRFVNFSEGL